MLGLQPEVAHASELPRGAFLDTHTLAKQKLGSQGGRRSLAALALTSPATRCVVLCVFFFVFFLFLPVFQAHDAAPPSSRLVNGAAASDATAETSAASNETFDIRHRGGQQRLATTCGDVLVGSGVSK
jgi:hypothetical protein